MSQLEKVAAIALEIAAFPSPATDKSIAARREIPAFMIDDLRKALEADGVDWRKFRAERRKA